MTALSDVIRALIQAHEINHDSPHFYIEPLYHLLQELQSGKFCREPLARRRSTLMGLQGQYFGKGEVFRRLAPHILPIEFQNRFSRAVESYLAEATENTGGS